MKKSTLVALVAAFGISALTVAACNQEQQSSSQQSSSQDQQQQTQNDAPVNNVVEPELLKGENPFLKADASVVSFELAQQAWQQALEELKEGKLANVYNAQKAHDEYAASFNLEQARDPNVTSACNLELRSLLDRMESVKYEPLELLKDIVRYKYLMNLVNCTNNFKPEDAIESEEFKNTLHSNTSNLKFNLNSYANELLQIELVQVPEVQAAINDNSVSLEDFAKLYVGAWTIYADKLQKLDTTPKLVITNTNVYNLHEVLVEGQPNLKEKKDALIRSVLADDYLYLLEDIAVKLETLKDKSDEEVLKQTSVSRKDLEFYRDYALAQLRYYAQKSLVNTGFALYK